ncbi:hypothetical protein [Rhodothermus bifroesti]|uniref:hypothetical protein n=1 Tax=Rhodothermus bifroesti TaxID=2823335 RepID=UPI001AF0185D|nr:hypothetical protein [Rhodothermus bifroesti]
MWSLIGRDPADVAAEALCVPEPSRLSFEGFSTEAFAALERLKAQPHLEQYRLEKPLLQQHVQQPFRRLRDDLVVHWVLPNALALETERNVFSRFLKNDFGAGGCYAHYWMAFYRQGWRRLADVQLMVSLHADGLRAGVYVGEPARTVWQQVRVALMEEGIEVLRSLLPLLQFKIYLRKGNRRLLPETELPQALPAVLRSAEGLWAGATLSREEVLHCKSAVVFWILTVWRQAWPLYRFCCAVSR